ncbi:OmpA family protein [Vibrio sinaloensis]|uniref:OmpA family protein n=1 Tax=Photobacterium sp. (strain ATCC 43367) TaxID=379097 RepID=UPI00205F9206|nr:OmpA family protein [Vibrio sinaloensis]UPQ88651.1 OmpA family protein [Vibrio sinaloensis]
MNKLAVMVSSALVLASAGANAQFYLGGKVGTSWLDDACTAVTATCDDESIAAGLLAGYEFFDFLSLEAGYDYLGEFSAAGLNDEKVKAYTLAPKLNLALNEDWSLYGKFGGARVEYGSYNDSSFLGAVGLELDSHKNVTVRLEYQRLTDVSNPWAKAAVNSATLGFVYKFGASPQSVSEPVVMEEKVVQPMVEEVKPEVAPAPVVKTFQAKVIDSGAFAHDSTTLKSESQPAITELASFMKQFPQSKVEVTGYTDSSGPAAYNQKLSEKRAQSVAAALIEQGIAPERITATGQGENNPIATNDSPQGRAKNRRVEIVVPSFEYQE